MERWAAGRAKRSGQAALPASEIHAAFAAHAPVELSRLDELLALLDKNLRDPVYARARDLLLAMASPERSAALHVRDAVGQPEPS